MENQMQNRRRNYFIDKHFQSQFIFEFCVIVLVGSILIGLFAYYLNMQTTTVAFENLKVVVKTTADFILPVILQILVLVTLFVSIATGALALFASHKIAGPLYKLKMEMGKMKNGDFSSPVHIRSTDQLKTLALECDEMRTQISGSIVSLKNEWNQIKIILEETKEKTDETNKRKIEDRIKNLDFEFSKIKVS